MFRLEKVFQNDDTGFILFVNFTKSILLLILAYSFIILKDNTIYDLSNYNFFKNSNYFFFSIITPIIYFLISFFLKNKLVYQNNFISFLREDISNLAASSIITLSLIFIFNLNFKIDFFLINILILNMIFLGISKLYFNFLYQQLIDKNIIQKNIMLVGTYDEIKKVMKEKFDKIIIFKCCIITNLNNLNLKVIKSEIKFPVFNENEDIRSILEYHSLGQIWILNANKSKSKIFSKIFKFSVDTLNVNLDKTHNLKGKKLLANKYDYEFFEKSRFYGVNLFLKILIDKFLSLIFLVIASPILFISALAIYLEDGLLDG